MNPNRKPRAAAPAPERGQEADLAAPKPAEGEGGNATSAEVAGTNRLQMNALAELAQASLKDAAAVREKARLIESHARDLLGRLSQAAQVNHSNPAQATALILKARVQFEKAS